MRERALDWASVTGINPKPINPIHSSYPDFFCALHCGEDRGSYAEEGVVISTGAYWKSFPPIVCPASFFKPPSLLVITAGRPKESEGGRDEISDLYEMSVQ